MYSSFARLYILVLFCFGLSACLLYLYLFLCFILLFFLFTLNVRRLSMAK